MTKGKGLVMKCVSVYSEDVFFVAVALGTALTDVNPFFKNGITT